jgi:hypothetical protein
VIVDSSFKHSLSNVLDHGQMFINLEERGERGDTLLMLLARNYGHGYLAEKFDTLLNRGADIHARNYSGQTCLHIAVINVRWPSVKVDEVGAIVLLIQRGADIFTTDDAGVSIFENAYKCGHDTRRGCPNGSYQGDLWDAVLSRCGLGEHIWPPEERVYHYTKVYTESHFRQLWEGWEHLFPYPPGTSSPCPCTILEDVDEDEDEEGYGEEESDEDEDDKDEDDEYDGVGEYGENNEQKNKQ